MEELPQVRSSFYRIFDFMIKRFGFVIELGEYVGLMIDTVKAIIVRPPSTKLVFKQIYDIGVTSILVVSITGFSTGLVLAAQAYYQLSNKGLSSVTGTLVAAAMLTELGPVLTAFMVTGRVGASICAELGTMQVTEQVDALRSMAVNPNRYLVAPRLIAGVCMVPLLTIYSVIMGVFGGYLISTSFFNIPPSTFFDPIPDTLSSFDVFMNISKSTVFGIIILSIACFRGMKTTGGAEGVGSSTTRCVVITYCVILITNFFMTLTLNIFGSFFRGLFR